MAEGHSMLIVKELLRDCLTPPERQLEFLWQ